MTVASLFTFLFGANWQSAILAMSGSFLYVVFYTIILKPRTSQNIVWGGLAGAVPPIVGYAVASPATVWTSLEAWWLVVIIFFWTPPHFWSLALYIKDEYHKAKIPMLPVVKGDRRTKIEIAIYTLVLVASVLSLYFISAQLELVYVITSSVLSIWLLYETVQLFKKQKQRTYILYYLKTMLYLFLLFTIISLESVI